MCCALLAVLVVVVVVVDIVRELVMVGLCRWEGRTPPLARVSTHEGAEETALTTDVVAAGAGAACRREATVRQVDDSGLNPARRDTGIN